MYKPAIAVLLGTVLATAAAAQNLDYAALEQLFGEPVTTSVTGSPQRASEAAASMEIIDANDIRRSGARDLPSLLRHVAGVDVLQSSADYADVSVRGYNQAFPPRLLVLVDGRQVYADYYGFTPWATIPIELAAIRQIEVVRGPNSALFGFNAVGGVVNIITYDPFDDMASSASVRMGTQALTEFSAVSGWKIGDSAGLRVSAGHRRSDDFSTPQQAFDVGSRRGNERDALSLESSVRLGARMTADFELTRSDVGQTERGPVYSTGFTTYQTESAKAHMAADTRLGLIEGTVYGNDVVGRVFNQMSGTPYLVFDSDVTVAQLQSVSKLGTAQTLRLSAEYRESAMATTPIAFGEVSYNVASLGAMWDWRVATAVTLTNALRVDDLDLGRRGAVPPGYAFTNADWDRERTVTSYNSGLVWQVDEVNTLRFTVGRGTQLPSLFNLGGLLIPLPGGFVTGVPTLEPSTVRNYEAIWNRPLTALNATLRVSTFAGRTSHVVAAAGGTDFSRGIFGAPANIGSSSAEGVEIALEGTHGDWRWSGSYTPMRIDDRLDAGYNVQNTQVDFENTTPRHVLNASLGWSRARWEVDGFLRYQSSFDGVAGLGDGSVVGVLEPISDYVTLDARVGFAVNRHITLALAGQGLVHSEQRQTSGVDVERRLSGNVTVAF
jgi:outer membrane receptor for ferrienterochelin and colicins